MNDFIKVSFGIVVGILIVLVVYFGYKHFILVNYPDNNDFIICEYHGNSNISAKKVNSIQSEIVAINKRYDDFLIFQGIIITILLAMGLGVYFRAQHEISRYFNDNFATYKTGLEKIKKESESLLSEMKNEIDILSELKRETLQHNEKKQEPPKQGS